MNVKIILHVIRIMDIVVVHGVGSVIDVNKSVLRTRTGMIVWRNVAVKMVNAIMCLESVSVHLDGWDHCKYFKLNT